MEKLTNPSEAVDQSTRSEGFLEDTIDFISAMEGCPEAATHVGLGMLTGHGFEKDEISGARWISFAAERGVPRAMAILGTCYEYGIGVLPNLENAAVWFRKAAELGSASGQHFLGTMYLTGRIESPEARFHGLFWLMAAAAGEFEKSRELLEQLERVVPAKEFSEARSVSKDWLAKPASQRYWLQ